MYRNYKKIIELIKLKKGILRSSLEIKDVDLLKKYYDLFNKNKYPLLTLNIDSGVIICILSCIMYLLLNQSEKNFNKYNKPTITILYFLAVYYILIWNKTIASIYDNSNLKLILFSLLIGRTFIQLYLFMKTQEKPQDVEDDRTKDIYFIPDTIKIVDDFVEKGI